LFHEGNYTPGFVFRGVWDLCISERSFWLLFIVDPRRFGTLPFREKKGNMSPRVRGVISFLEPTVDVEKLSSVPKKLLLVSGGASVCSVTFVSGSAGNFSNPSLLRNDRGR
jgi:hypothetical protein